MSARKAKDRKLDNVDLSSLVVRGEAEVELAADPSVPNRSIRRARRVWLPDVLLKKGSIGQAHHDACTRYLSSYELGVAGARDRNGIMVDGRVVHSGPADAQLAAITDYRKATAALGSSMAVAVDHCVLGTGTLASLGTLLGVNEMHAAGYMVAALDRLADHFGY